MPSAVVTGASRGLGLETCAELARDGYDVVAGCRDVESGERAVRGVHAPTGRLRTVALDVVDDASVRAATASLAENPGRIDVLVNNAGASFDGFDASVAARTLDTNYRGAARVRTGMGGSAAPRSVEEGARSIVWAATRAQQTGGFHRDGRSIDW